MQIIIYYFSIDVSNDAFTSLANFQSVKSLLYLKIFQIFEFMQF